MRDIARSCGLTTGALYHYFQSKDDILSLFQEITAAELQKFAEENLENLYKMPPLAAITGVIEAIISFVDKTQDVTVFWYQEARNLNPAQMTLLLQREDHEIGLIKKILRWGCERGEFKIKDINLMAHDIIVLCDMWAFRRWMLRRDYTVEEFKQAQTELILSRIKGTSA
jgi:AcrR family transcriptional regulator